ncbi:MAG: site-specific tyrosine recombinase XerD [Bacteroidetes bacterium GWF2_41_31]|nr:MAG: site-specific tyrosine recombinase XerD [Bacteroidetes bacterium GWF2_41_31]OFZ04828.1 MAG: site-specific tyrosine recombinase XerD [Bacteroidetes bacterium RIFOXYB12_FULL_41_6]
MSHSSIRNGFKTYLQLERGLSVNTLEAYLHDVDLFLRFLEESGQTSGLNTIKLENLQDFIGFITEMELGSASQARVISGIKAFFRYLVIEKLVETDPTELLQSPQMGMKLPEYLTIEEIELLIAQIDLSSSQGERNKAIIETLYGCGLRVSELINMSVSDLHLKEGIISVTGKGDKQRLVPLGSMAEKQITTYLKQIRVHVSPKKGSEDVLFLNIRGTKLSRQMVFLVVKELVQKAGIKKRVSPHTFRHSYATHLVQNGANLRAVQELLGHASITTTEIYTHLNIRDLRKAILKYHPRNTSY